MNNSNPKKKTNGTVKWLIALVVLLLVAAGIRLSLQSDWLLDYARGLIVQQANDQLNGHLEIDSIKGDILFGVTVTGVTLRDRQENDILRVDTLEVNYTLPSLIRKPHRLDLLRVNGLQGSLVQDEDSVWNAEKLLPESEAEEGEPLYWSVDRLMIDRANVAIQSGLLPDGRLEVDELSLHTMIEMFPDRWFVSLDHLSMNITEGRLPSPVEISVRAAASDRLVTLESLIVNTGRSLLNSEGAYIDGEGVQGEADLAPLSRRDVIAYMSDYPVRKNIDLDLDLEGTVENLTVSVSADAGSGGRFTLSAGTDITDPFLLKQLTFEAERFNGVELIGDSTLPSVQYAKFSGTGRINLSDIEKADFEGDLLVESLSLEPYALDRGEFSYRLSDGGLSARGSLQKQGQMIGLTGRVTDLFGEQPLWDGSATAENLNLAEWLADPSLESRLGITIEAEGEGFEPGEMLGSLEVDLTEGRFRDQEISMAQLSSNITPDRINGNLSAEVRESSMSADFAVDSWLTDPGYEFSAGFEQIDLTNFSGFSQEFPTRINGSIRGRGQSFDLKNLQLTARAAIDSSLINGEPIDSLRAEVAIRDQVVFVEKASLDSDIADAMVTLRQHLFELTDPQNRLNFTADFKDLHPLSPLFGLERLSAVGELEGELNRNAIGQLEFTGDIELRDIEADTLFTAEKITGNATARLLEEIELDGRLEIGRPVVMNQGIQDFIVSATAIISEDETAGDIGFELINDNESEIIHVGRYSITPEQSRLTTSRFDFVTQGRTLSLQENFDITYDGNTLQVDTMRVHSAGKEAFIEFSAPQIDNEAQRVYMELGEINMGVLQRTLIDEEITDGMLSGHFQYHNSSDTLSLSTRGIYSQIEYEKGRMDTLQFVGSIENEWLDVAVNGIHEGSELFSSYVRVPYLPGDPLTFDEQFFDRAIDGRFLLNESAVDYWLSFVPGSAAEATSGTVSFSGNLSGKAGMPQFKGGLNFRDGRLSGVPIESFDMSVLYEHEDSQLDFAGNIISRGTEVLDIASQVPFKIDLREAELELPSNEDSLRISLQSRELNLAIVNDFLNNDMVRGIKGRLNGDVSVTGTLGNLQPEGYLELRHGSIGVVEAGITLSEMKSRINLSSEELELENFSMRSGPGRIRASGSVDLENLQPGELDLEIRGSQFRAANTQQYNAIVDFTSKITGTVDKPNLSGSLTFLSGFVKLQNFGERAVEDVVLEGEEEANPLEFYDSMEIEMDVNFQRQFFIRNSQFLDLEIELDGRVDLLKSRQEELEMFGQLEGVSGYARPLGKNFELDEAFVTFTGPVDNPDLNVRTQYEPPESRTDITIYYIIEGTGQEPEFRFDSEPEMELQNILSYTIFGRPFYELESWEQVVAGSGGGPTVADVAMDVILDRVEILASQQLGIDVVRIDNSRTGSDSSTSILTGWYLNRRTFFALVNEVDTNPKTLFVLEYLLRENLELIITQGDDSRQGVDLRWKYEY